LQDDEVRSTHDCETGQCSPRERREMVRFRGFCRSYSDFVQLYDAKWILQKRGRRSKLLLQIRSGSVRR
jgi:hypothetical protein